MTYYLAASGGTGGAYTLDELLQLSSIMHKSRRHLDSVYFYFGSSGIRGNRDKIDPQAIL